MTHYVGNLGDELRISTNMQPNAQVVAEKADVLDPGIKLVGILHR